MRCAWQEDIMRTKTIGRAAAIAASVTAVLGGTTLASAATGQPGHGSIKHVLLISVDALHQQDLTWYVKNHPHSVLAGLVGQVTGGNPRSTGIYYDDTWNHDVFPAGTTKCSGPVPGGEVAYTEADDINLNRLDAGQGLAGLPGSILEMTSDPLQVINPKNLPVDPVTCKPIDPNQYLKVNTIFNVARDHGLRTAWSDKHPAYQILSGPSGTGVQDYFTPEINSQAIGFPAGEDWTSD